MNISTLLRIIFISVFVVMGYSCTAQNESFLMSQIGPNYLLDRPFDLSYGPDGYLWVTEKVTGKVVRVDPSTGFLDELIRIPDAFSTGGQDGLLGLAFDQGFLSGNPYVYLSYSTGSKKEDLKQKLVRYTYNVNGSDGSLSSQVVLLDNLPANNDHNSGRLITGSDNKLYYTIGDQANKDCDSNLAQILPTQLEIDQENWSKYPGKVLRLNKDGSIPADNPVLGGVKSHIYSYGHRNPQGLVFGENGILYSDEHGPSSDDEVNILNAGKNYGWPRVAGFRDNMQVDAICDANSETSFVVSNYQDPVMSMFLANAYRDPACTDSWMCRPNVAPSSIAIYESNVMPTWKNSLLVTSLKKGRVYRLKLNSDGTEVDLNDVTQYFYTQNRYRDIVVSPDGKSFFIITDSSGKTSDASGMNVVTTMANPGAILKFTLQDPLKVKSMEIEKMFKIWPNPIKHTIFIESNKYSKRDLKAVLINSIGQIVKQNTEFQAGMNEIKVEGLSAGVYILRIYSKEYLWHQRLILY